jgi:hypothetical protein
MTFATLSTQQTQVHVLQVRNQARANISDAAKLIANLPAHPALSISLLSAPLLPSPGHSHWKAWIKVCNYRWLVKAARQYSGSLVHRAVIVRPCTLMHSSAHSNTRTP